MNTADNFERSSKVLGGLATHLGTIDVQKRKLQKVTYRNFVSEKGKVVFGNAPRGDVMNLWWSIPNCLGIYRSLKVISYVCRCNMGTEQTSSIRGF